MSYERAIFAVPQRLGLRHWAAISVWVGLSGCGETIDEQDGADIFVDHAEVSPSEVTVGQSATVTITLVNQGVAPGEHPITLEADDELYLVQERVVRPPNDEDPSAHERVVEMSYIPEEPGEVELTVNGVVAGTVSALPLDVDIQVVSTDTDPDLGSGELLVGEPISVFADLQNFGEANGQIDLELRADGELLAEKTAPVPSAGPGGDPDHTEYRATLEWIPETVGTRELSVGGESVGAAEVLSRPEVTIVQPANEPDEFFVVSDEEEGEGGFVDLELVASAEDELDGALEGEALQWQTTADENDDGSVDARFLGAGAEVTARLYANDDQCGSLTEHLIEVEATNSVNVTEAARHRVVLLMGLC